MAHRLRIFVSSPGDVPDERLRADLIIDKLAQDYARFVTIESYRWEHEPMLASGHFQDAIEPPSTSDIVILILWSRLGTPLPERTSIREYRGLDGRVPVTGTEWEFEDALASARQRGAPDILVFRNISPAALDLRDAAARGRSLAQLDALEAFWKRYFADRGVFLAGASEYPDIEQFAVRLEESLRKLIERRIKLGTGSRADEAPTWLGNPFRGLQAYEFEHAAIYFGRDALVAKAAEQLALQARAGSAFLLLVGGSGSGKSSLIKAALVPRLMKPQRIEGAAFLRRVVFRPGDAQQDLILGLANALTGGSAHDAIGLPELLAPGQSAADLASHLRASLDQPAFVFGSALGRVTEAARAAKRILPHESAKLILIIDQAEELFTFATITGEERTAFVRLLAGLARSGGVWILASMRADFWHRILDLPELVTLAQGHGRVEVPPPSPAEIAEMIRKPAQAAGLTFQVDSHSGLGLDSMLAEDAASEPGVLPLLSFTLDALYSEDVEKRGGHELTVQQYQALGGLDGAIAQRAEEIIEGLAAQAQAAGPHVLRSLATLGGDGNATPVARAVPLHSFPPGSDARAIVDAFIAARLLVASSDGETATVRVAHEALISRWKRAREQLASDRRDLETRALIERQYARWRQANEALRRQLLLRDPDLANAMDLRRRWPRDLAPDVQAFIVQSHVRSRRRHQLAAAAAVVFGLVAFAASGFGVLAYRAQQQAEQQRVRAIGAEAVALTRRDEALQQRNAALTQQSRSLAWEAEDLIRQGPVRGAIALLRYALPAADGSNDRPLVRDAVVAAYKALYANRERRRMVMPDGATAVVSNAAGKRVVIATPREIVVRDGFSEDGERKLGHEFGRVSRMVIAPDDQRLAIIGAVGTVWVHDLQSNSQRRCFEPEGLDPQVEFLQSGRRLLVGSSDRKSWHLIDADTCRELAARQLAAAGDKAPSVLVDPARSVIVIAGGARVRRLSSDDLSDVATGEVDEAGEYALALAPDGSSIYLAAAQDLLSGRVLVLDAATLATQRTMRGLAGARFVAVSSDAKWLAVHGIMGIDFFDLQTGERMHRIVAAGDKAVRGRFVGRPGSSDYIAYGPQGFLRRYVPALGAQLGTYDAHDVGAVEEVEDLPDHSGFLALSNRPAVIEWSFDAQLISRQYVVPLILHGMDLGMAAPISASAITPDGAEVLVAYTDGSARGWTLENGAMRVVRDAASERSDIRQVAQVGETSVLVEASGRLLVHTPAGGPASPVAVLAGEPLSYLGEIDSSHAVMIARSGAAAVLDVSSPTQPQVQPVAALGACPRGVAIAGLVLCAAEDGTLRIYRPADRRLLLDLPPPTGAKLSSAYLASDASSVMASYSTGELLMRSLGDGATLLRQSTSMKLSGDVLRQAAESPILSDEDRAKIRGGATELEVRTGAQNIVLAPGGKVAAVAMPDRTVQLLDLATGAVRILRSKERIGELDFSRNGTLLAVVEGLQLSVYETANGERLVSISLIGQVSPKLHHLPDGKGFATIDQTGSIRVHPVFEDVHDLIRYLAHEFPAPLTAEERRAYFID